jgi:Domain of unknown function (DUF1844)
MAELQRNKVQLSGEMTQRFIEFIMMQAQQAALFLGRIPNPQTGKPERNLEVARMLIDQLEMIREKTRGNLNHEETEILASILADLQLRYIQAGEQPATETMPPAPATSSLSEN